MDHHLAQNLDVGHLSALVEACPNLVGIASSAGELLFLNAAGRSLIALDVDAQLSLPLAGLFCDDDQGFVREVVLNALERDDCWNGPLRLRGQTTGLPVAVELSLYHLYTATGGAGPAGIAIIAMDATERRRSEQRLRALLDTGSTLTNTLDVKQMFRDLAELLVRTLATICVVDLFTERSGGVKHLERMASYHIDREWRGAGAQIASFTPSSDNRDHPVQRLIREGSSTLVTHMDDAWIDAHASSADHAAMIRAMKLRSLITVPLVAGGEIVGALTCSLGGEATPRAGIPAAYDAEDLFFVEELGRRAGRSIETARLYERERRIAETLQAASLPQSLPSTAHYHIDAEYRPGRAEATIGGDWYDAFESVDGRVILTVGDVLGNGLNAAVTMTKLRQAMQAAAMVDPAPNVMLDVADRTLRLHAGDGYATAIAAIYEPAAQTTCIASAGHPGPIVRMPDGTIVDYESAGILLGLREGTDTTVTEIPTPPGSLVVFFTDGLTEHTRDVDEGLRRLRAAISEALAADSVHPARAIVEMVLRGDNAGDDIAVLTLMTR